jgi:DNA-binding transcriptional LysR family regulator
MATHAASGGAVAAVNGSVSLFVMRKVTRQWLQLEITRRVALTEAGERYLHRCYAIIGSIAQAEAEASDAHGNPVGTLRVHAMSSLGQNYVVPTIAAYQARYPSVTVDTPSQNVPDLIEDSLAESNC